MRYIAIDIKTTGLDPERHQILEIAAVADDLNGEMSPNTFHCFVLHDEIVGSHRAICMNAEIIREIDSMRDDYWRIHQESTERGLIPPLLFPGDVASQFRYWLRKHGVGHEQPVTFAGKNVAGSVLPFLRKFPNWCNFIPSYHCMIDPAVYYLRLDDKVVPDLKTCLHRAGLSVTREHRALDDARAVVDLVRCHFRNRGQTH
jgi:oligoribonuclease